MFREARVIVYAALQEAQELLSVIKEGESTDPKISDPNILNILRGLFYVSLYASFECAIRKGLSIYILYITEKQIAMRHLGRYFHSISLDGVFKKLKDKERDVLETRIEFLKKQLSAEECSVDNDIFDLYLQNINSNRLKNIFNCLCINEPITPRIEFEGYINELVNKRNLVSHGRELISEVGRSKKHDDLFTIFNSIKNTIEYFFDLLEKNYNDLSFIDSSCKEFYAEL